MKREELKEMGLTDEQIEKIMAETGKDIQKAKSVADKYKEDAEKLAEVQKQLDEINTANMTEVEKANKQIEESNKRVADLENQLKNQKTRSDLATLGIIGEDADKIIEGLNGGNLDIEVLGNFISNREKQAVADFEKKSLDDTPNPSGGKDPEDNKTEAEKVAEMIAPNLVGSSQNTASIIDAYK